MRSLTFEVGLMQCFDEEATLCFKIEQVLQMPKVLWVVQESTTGSVSAVTGTDGHDVGTTIAGKAKKPSPLTNL